MNNIDFCELLSRGFVLSVLKGNKPLAIKFIDAAEKEEVNHILTGIANTLYNLKMKLEELDPEFSIVLDNICDATVSDACDCDVCRGEQQ